MDNFVFYNSAQIVYGRNNIEKIRKLLVAHKTQKDDILSILKIAYK
jgi:alcohol dehydrogenase YqhD (iron-dependent ADH family)